MENVRLVPKSCHVVIKKKTNWQDNWLYTLYVVIFFNSFKQDDLIWIL